MYSRWDVHYKHPAKVWRAGEADPPVFERTLKELLHVVGYLSTGNSLARTIATDLHWRKKAKSISKSLMRTQCLRECLVLAASCREARQIAANLGLQRFELVANDFDCYTDLCNGA